MTGRALFLAVLIPCLAADALEAQRYSSTFSRWEPETHSLDPTARTERQDSLAPARADYRYEGLAVGGWCSAHLVPG